MINEIHPKIHEIFKKATKSNRSSAGFDIIIENPEVDPDTQNGASSNAIPAFIDLHYYAKLVLK